MKFCQMCCDFIKDDERYYETWSPVHHIQCMKCHAKKKEGEAVQ